MTLPPLRAGLLATLGLALLAGCAHRPPYDPADPLEPVNRRVHTFNRTADKYILRPIAVGYDTVTPQPVQESIGNFMDNLTYPVTIVNSLLQGKFKATGVATGRFLLNSTAGLGGLIDVATPVGLIEEKEDFGQTLGHYGVGPGWYLMLPFLGPSNNRDFIGFVADSFTEPHRYFAGSRTQWIITGVDIINTRAGLLGSDRFLDQQVDDYIALRTIYLERRLNYVYDGDPPLDYGEEGLEDGFDLDDDSWREDFGG